MSDNPTAEAGLFRVVFLNEFGEGADVDSIRKNVAGQFNLSEQAAAHMFAGRPVVVKRNVDVATAFQFKMILDEIGALCQVETMPEVDDTDGHGYIERRGDEQRKKADRRTRMRFEHIVPDRRFAERRDGSPPEGKR